MFNLSAEFQPTGDQPEAIDKLVNDVLKKMNGFAEIGVPDKNDWIVTVFGQSEVYPEVMQAIDYLVILAIE